MLLLTGVRVIRVREEIHATVRKTGRRAVLWKGYQRSANRNRRRSTRPSSVFFCVSGALLCVEKRRVIHTRRGFRVHGVKVLGQCRIRDLSPRERAVAVAAVASNVRDQLVEVAELGVGAAAAELQG